MFFYIVTNTGFHFFFCQYQNVFAPLIKLEADYDKVLCSDNIS